MHALGRESAKAAAALGEKTAEQEAGATAAMLETEGSREVARGQTIRCLFRMASESSAEGELQRKTLYKLGGQAVLLRAMPRHQRWGERVHQLCATLAQLSTSATEQASLIELGAVRELVDMHEDALVAGLDANSHRSPRAI